MALAIQGIEVGLDGRDSEFRSQFPWAFYGIALLADKWWQNIGENPDISLSQAQEWSQAVVSLWTQGWRGVLQPDELIGQEHWSPEFVATYAHYHRALWEALSPAEQQKIIDEAWEDNLIPLFYTPGSSVAVQE